jgi:hypothetical protein
MVHSTWSTLRNMIVLARKVKHIPYWIFLLLVRLIHAFNVIIYIWKSPRLQIKSVQEYEISKTHQLNQHSRFSTQPTLSARTTRPLFWVPSTIEFSRVLGARATRESETSKEASLQQLRTGKAVRPCLRSIENGKSCPALPTTHSARSNLVSAYKLQTTLPALCLNKSSMMVVYIMEPSTIQGITLTSCVLSLSIQT